MTFQSFKKSWFKNCFVQRITLGTIKNRGSLLDSLSIITWSYIVFKIISFHPLFHFAFPRRSGLREWRYTFELYIYDKSQHVETVSSEIFKHLRAHHTTTVNYTPLPPSFLQAEEPDFIVCIKCVCFNMDKHSVTVQSDFTNNPQPFCRNTCFASVEARQASITQPSSTTRGGMDLLLSQITDTTS